MVYPNLEAELKRNNKKREDVAKLLDIHVTTASEKLTVKDRLKLSEAITIKNAWFPTMSMEYLYQETN